MRIVIINAHWNNRGDEAALYALLRFLQECNSHIELGIIFKECKTRPELDFEFQCKANIINTSYRLEEDIFKSILNESYNYDSLALKAEVDLINGSDAVIYAPGGAVICDRFFWNKQLEYLFPIAYAEKNNIPVFFANPSIGPFTEEHAIRDKILGGVYYMAVRESISKNSLKSCHSCGSDLVFMYDKSENKDSILDEGIKDIFFRYQKVIGISITDLKWNVGYLSNESIYKTIQDTFKEFINDLIDYYGCGVLLIPQLFGEQNDMDSLEFYDRQGVYILPDHYNSDIQQRIISKCYAVIGLRYHSCIFAINNEIPIIPVSYEQKMDGFCLDNGIERWKLSLNDLNRRRLRESFELLEKEYEDRKDKARRIKNSCRERALKSMNPIKEYIEQ